MRDVSNDETNIAIQYNDRRLKIQVQVNPEFSRDVASSYARQYAKEIGKLPIALRRYVRSVCIHDGNEPFGGDINYLLIHVI